MPGESVIMTKPSRTPLRFKLATPHRRALTSFFLLLVLWQAGATSAAWSDHGWPIISLVPAPSTVLKTWATLLPTPGYWESWGLSFMRVALGFFAAVAVGAPFGLLLIINRTWRGIAFPVFELLRPIPPLAWVPASIIFWPTQELSIDFVIFLGAFYTIVLNTVGGGDEIDQRLIQAARSMGGSRWNIFRRLILPSVLPSIGTGMQVGIGITWEVVIAAEMISGGSGDASAGGGLGYFLWSSYIGGSYPGIIVGMISIGIAGYISSAAMRFLVARATPWAKGHHS